MAIWGYIGGIGTGKTMNGAVEAIALAKRRDALILSNIRLELPPGVEGWRLPMDANGIDMDTVRALVFECQARGKGIVLFLDEVGILMPSRFWQDFPIDLIFVLSQSRKLGVDLIYTAQDVEQVDAILRRLTSWVWLVKSYPVGSIERRERGKRPWFFLLTRWKVKSIEGQFKQPIGRRVVRYRRAWEGLYSTDELVQPPEIFRERSRRRRGRVGTDASAGAGQLVPVGLRSGGGPRGAGSPEGAIRPEVVTTGLQEGIAGE